MRQVKKRAYIRHNRGCSLPGRLQVGPPECVPPVEVSLSMSLNAWGTAPTGPTGMHSVCVSEGHWYLKCVQHDEIAIADVFSVKLLVVIFFFFTLYFFPGTAKVCSFQ